MDPRSAEPGPDAESIPDHSPGFQSGDPFGPSDCVLKGRRNGAPEDNGNRTKIVWFDMDLISQAERRSPPTPDRGRGIDCGLRVERSWRIELAAGKVLGATPC